jgi:hypothetical protein
LCPVTLVLQGCETVSHLREEHKLRGFENKMLREYMNLMREEVIEIGEGCMVRSRIIFIF